MALPYLLLQGVGRDTRRSNPLLSVPSSLLINRPEDL
jgi:hypothetical protein